jgi:hypothetical protein
LGAAGASEEDQVIYNEVDLLFPRYEDDYFRQLIFNLSYTQHGGSGLGWSHHDIAGLAVQDAEWYSKRQYEERKAEVQAIKQANRRR